jgi:hypothetical protein
MNNVPDSVILRIMEYTNGTDRFKDVSKRHKGIYKIHILILGNLISNDRRYFMSDVIPFTDENLLDKLWSHRSLHVYLHISELFINASLNGTYLSKYVGVNATNIDFRQTVDKLYNSRRIHKLTTGYSNLFLTTNGFLFKESASDHWFALAHKNVRKIALHIHGYTYLDTNRLVYFVCEDRTGPSGPAGVRVINPDEWPDGDVHYEDQFSRCIIQ